MKRLGENNLAMIAARIKADYIPKSDTVQAQSLSVDNTPTEGSENLVTSGGVYDAVSDKEDTTNKVTSLSNANTDIQYPSAKAVYDSFYKRGVISQTQTWTQRTGIYNWEYAMSNLVYGNIPKSNIDLYETAGAIFNETTGYFELNGLTDISYEEMIDIYNFGQLPYLASYWLYQIRNIRTNLPTKRTNIKTDWFARDSYVEVMAFNPNKDAVLSSETYAFYGCKYLSTILGVIDISGYAGSARPFENMNNLTSCSLKSIKGSFNFAVSGLLSVASILYMINNSAATSAITITLHATAYARAIADTDVQTALQNHPLVTLASA